MGKWPSKGSLVFVKRFIGSTYDECKRRLKLAYTVENSTFNFKLTPKRLIFKLLTLYQNDSVIYSKIRFSSSKRDVYELDKCLWNTCPTIVPLNSHFVLFTFFSEQRLSQKGFDELNWNVAWYQGASFNKGYFFPKYYFQNGVFKGFSWKFQNNTHITILLSAWNWLTMVIILIIAWDFNAETNLNIDKTTKRMCFYSFQHQNLRRLQYNFNK